MKIGIITFHRPCNYGAMLQATALYKKIVSLGQQCEIIDYENDNLKHTYTLDKIKDAKNIKQFIKKIIKIILFNHNNKIKYKKFEHFIKNNCNLSEKKYDKTNIADTNNKYDKFLTGSDQVWNLNLTAQDYNYLLEFVIDNNKKFSYSSSFGYSEIPCEYQKKCKDLFNQYSKITVREKNGQDIIKKLIDKDVEIVLDPTLLLNKDEWRNMEKECKINIPEQYILAYFVSPTKQDYKFVKELSKKKKMKIVLINYGNNIKWGMKNVTKAGPEEFLWLLRNATYVVTNSFHGTAFSINFNKEFFYQLSSKSKNGNNRIENIINICGLNDRNVEVIDIEKIHTIKWEEVNRKLEKERMKSLDYLEKILC